MRGSHTHPKVTTTGVPPALPLGGDPLPHTPAQKACASGGLSPSGPAVGGRRGRSSRGSLPQAGCRQGAGPGLRWALLERGGEAPLWAETSVSLRVFEGQQAGPGRLLSGPLPSSPLLRPPALSPQPSSLGPHPGPRCPITLSSRASPLPRYPPPSDLLPASLWHPLGSAGSPDHLPGQAPGCGVPPGPRLSCCHVPRGHLGRGQTPRTAPALGRLPG